MKKLLLVLVFLTLTNSCSKSDDDQTFLERYDGVGFYYDEVYPVVNYWYFYNSNVFLKYVETSEYGVACDSVSEGFSDYFQGTISIVTNKNNNLLVEITSDDLSYPPYSIEFNVSGNNLTINSDGEIINATKTDVTRSSFTCTL
tara:strand:+ start:440 stop:871 length:432 start_codon:yes stop_codon:yes gene_type:complete